MPIFLVLILLATFEMSLRKTFSTKKTLIVGTSLVIFGFIGYTIFPHENIRDLLFGI
jgi:membrane associated rhomboid family serine protease